ncbi:MAG: hypothetical protein SFW67_14970 [Myxococcaceae bacterium]|nr:hypothetical protein [Myxococcaceae bacterium]
MLGLSMLVLLAGTDVTANVTGGVAVSSRESLESTDPALLAAPLLAGQVDLSRRLAVGTIRGRLAQVVTLGFLTAGQLPGPGMANALQPQPVQLNDLASFVEFESAKLGGSGPSIALRLFPFQDNTRLVSFDWANAVTRVNAPVVAVDVRSPSWFGWAAVRFPMRTALALNPALSARNLYPDVLGGLGWTGERWRVEARAGRTQYGREFDRTLMALGPEQWGVLAAGQVVFRVGEELAPPLDLVTSSADPTRFERFFAPPPVPVGAVAFTAALEGGAGTQFVSRFGQPAAENRLIPAWVDLQLRLRVHQTRLFLTGRAQSTAHLTFDLAGSGLLNPPEAGSYAFLAGFVGVDHVFHRLNLTPQVLLRVVQPGAVTGLLGIGTTNPRMPTSYVIGEVGEVTLQSSSIEVRPTLGGKVALRWNPVPALAVVAEVDVTIDLMREVIIAEPGQLVPRSRSARGTRSTLALQGRF